MQLAQDTSDDIQIKSYEPGKIVINSDEYTHSVIVTPTKIMTTWQPQILTELKRESFKTIIELEPTILLLGVGTELVFPDFEILTDVYAAHIGVEIMNTGAACRTFNLLASDGRNVAAALLLS